MSPPLSQWMIIPKTVPDELEKVSLVRENVLEYMWQSVVSPKQKLRADWHERCWLSMFTLLTLSLRRDYFEKTKKGAFFNTKHVGRRFRLMRDNWVCIQNSFWTNIWVISAYFLDVIVDRATNDPSCACWVLGCFSGTQVRRWHHYKP